MADILGERDDAVPQRPTRVSEMSRESQLPRRFYKDVLVTERKGRLVAELDGRPIKTPGKQLLAFESPIIADAVAEEWRGQRERIDPMSMPLTRLAHSAIDGVAIDMQAVKEDVVRYAGTDLLCYRAGRPQGLIDRQMALWDPLIDWAQAALSVRLALAEGVMHVEQPERSIAAFSAHVGDVNDPLTLAALHVATSITGSAILAMALLKGEVGLDKAWQIAHVDEDWNIADWGVDDEAAHRRAARFVDMKAAALVLEQAA
ncbi:MAG: ATP12 family chaperone protein [Rhizobiaceae bacterium]